VQICFSVFLIFYAYFENTPKELCRSRRIRRKYLIVFGNGAKILYAYTEITAILEWFYLYKVVSEYAESILTCTENTLKAFKRVRRIRQEYLAVYGDYADKHKTEPISPNIRPKPKKFQILYYHSIHDRIGKKPISRYCPFNYNLYARLILVLLHTVDPETRAPENGFCLAQ
jgi:hypothetical protein